MLFSTESRAVIREASCLVLWVFYVKLAGCVDRMKHRRFRFAFQLRMPAAIVAIAICAGAAPSFAEPPSSAAAARKSVPAKAKPKAQKSKASSSSRLSIGAPNQGKLSGGMRLRPTKHMQIKPNARTWGTPELVKMIKRAASLVARKHRGSKLFVGDMSARRGGPIEGHNSHQSGRDVDIAFFVANSKGDAVHPKRFVAFDASGQARDLTWARFDEARNWTLVEALLSDEQANVRYLFISNALKARLLSYAAKKKVSADIIAKAASAMVSPAGADVHDDHFHVRIACPVSSQSVCVEESALREQENP